MYVAATSAASPIIADDDRSLAAQFWAQLGWRRLLFALSMSLVLATQILFQPSVVEDYSLSETLESFVLYLFDLTVIALPMICAVAWIDLRLPDESTKRTLGLLVAIVLSVLTGIAVQMVVHYDAGPYPPWGFVLGEALRWALIGGAITLIFETIRRHHVQQQALFAAELRHKILDNQMIETRIKMMEAQIEPHFLFNTLATVKRLYRTEPIGGVRMLERLKSYLKAALPQIRHGIPTLGSELELVRAYLEILQIRLGSRLDFAIDAPTETLTAPFPPMVLITLVENAIKHGLNPMPAGGRIEIEVFSAANAVVVEVRDNGVGLHVTAGATGAGMGLTNIHERLKALYGTDASLRLLQREPSGVIARVVVSAKSDATPALAADVADGQVRV